MKLLSKRPQFSLLTLLMVMTIVALAIVAYREYFAASKLRAENTKLIQQRKILAARSGAWDYIQPDEFHVCMLDELMARNVKDGLYAWQIHVPESHYANVYLIWNKIEPAEKLWARCKTAPSLILSSGGQLLSFRIFHDRKGRWNYEMSCQGQKLQHQLDAQESVWLNSDARFRRDDSDPQGEFKNDAIWNCFFGGLSGAHSLVPSGKHVLFLDRYPNGDEIQLDSKTPTNGLAILLQVEKQAVRKDVQMNSATR